MKDKELRKVVNDLAIRVFYLESSTFVVRNCSHCGHETLQKQAVLDAGSLYKAVINGFLCLNCGKKWKPETTTQDIEWDKKENLKKDK